MPPPTGSGKAAPAGIGYRSPLGNSSNSAGSPGPAGAGVLLSPFLGTEIFGGVESDSGFKIPEPSCSLSAVQDALSPVHTGGPAPRGFPYLNRFDGSVSPCPHSPSLSEIPKVLSCESALPVSGSPIRPCLGSSSIHQNNGCSGRSSSDLANQNSVLSRRSPYSIQVSTSSPTGSVYDPSGLKEPRVFHQYRKEPFGTDDSHPTPGGSHRHIHHHSISVSGTPDQFAVTGQVSHVRGPCSSEVFIPASGEDGILHRDSPLGTPSLQAPAVVSSPVPKEAAGSLPSQSSSPHQGSEVSSLVDFSSSEQGHGLQRTRSSGLDHRRKPLWLGGSPRVRNGSGQMDPSRSISQYQLAGTESHPPGITGLSGQSSGSRHSHKNRQHGCKGPCQSLRRDPLSALDEGGGELGPLGGTAPQIDKGNSHLRGGECPGRQAKSNHTGPGGMEHSPGFVQGIVEPIWLSRSRSFCHTGQCPDSEVFQQVSFSRGRRCGCSMQQLASRPSIRFPPLLNCQSSQETIGGASGNHLDSTSLASSALVCGSSSPISPTSLEDSASQGGSDSGIPDTTVSKLASANRLAVVRRLLREVDVSPRIIRTLQSARRASTNRIYDATWARFASWCSKRNLAPTEASTSRILDFLQDGLDAGLSPNTLRRQVALASIRVCRARGSLSQVPLIWEFLRAASNLRPPTLHRYPSWDLSRVLNALTKPPFEPLREVGLKFLTYKVVFLVAITSAHRISELAALSSRPDLCVFHTDRVVLRLDPTFVPKINTPFHRAQELVLPNFCPNPSHALERSWHTLDVCRALQIYLKRTSPIRRSEARFVSFQPISLGQKVSSPTLGRWLRASIATAYSSQALPIPRHITAHSTRSASTSAAWAT
ncbi:uncharacterized protein LOC131189221 isoform X1 [Ahaetulla prasina]|uniref:uncharacterized protein LOC131189221 isoform X1 n=1 Tax=Ahaetulla prasina TaxID=499056 RepID=UPI00264A4BFF|nr:uncharacterized protein LOC131189221 isoform X1 [Ahaetulla prasina]